MTLSKFKVCLACGEHNTPARLECKRCESDLTGVKVVDEAALRAVAATGSTSDSEGESDAAAQELVKICDCGATNPPQARKCGSCGEDISDIRATKAERAASAKAVSLRAIGDDFSFSLRKPVTLIGREADMKAYLGAKSYVSRNHAKITIADGDVYIENLSETNRTFVNGELIPCDAPTLLRDGDEIGLGGKMIDGKRQEDAAYFVFEASE
jgi:ribosomal protein L40E